MKKYPIGIQSFEKIRSGNFYYIEFSKDDKNIKNFMWEKWTETNKKLSF